MQYANNFMASYPGRSVKIERLDKIQAYLA